VGLRRREQRPASRQLAREQHLEQVSAMTVGFRDSQLAELDVRLPGERARDVDEADQRRRERQRRLAARG
jgi:hypothetical protein